MRKRHFSISDAQFFEVLHPHGGGAKLLPWKPAAVVRYEASHVVRGDVPAEVAIPRTWAQVEAAMADYKTWLNCRIGSSLLSFT